MSSSLLGAYVDNTEPARLPGPEPLNGRYVKLERLTQDHFTDLYESIGPSHPDLWTWWPDEPPSTRPEFNEYLAQFLGNADNGNDMTVYSAIPLSGPSKSKAAGLGFTLSEHRLTNRVAEVGAFFGPPLQRTREGTEAIFLLSDLLFRLNHRRLGWKTNTMNLPSMRAAERYGFVYEGTLRKHRISKGKNRDTCWYSILDSEWPLCRRAFKTWLEDDNFDEQERQKRRLEDVRNDLRSA